MTRIRRRDPKPSGTGSEPPCAEVAGPNDPRPQVPASTACSERFESLRDAHCSIGGRHFSSDSVFHFFEAPRVLSVLTLGRGLTRQVTAQSQRNSVSPWSRIFWRYSFYLAKNSTRRDGHF